MKASSLNLSGRPKWTLLTEVGFNGLQMVAQVLKHWFRQPSQNSIATGVAVPVIILLGIYVPVLAVQLYCALNSKLQFAFMTCVVLTDTNVQIHKCAHAHSHAHTHAHTHTHTHTRYDLSCLCWSRWH